MVDIIWVGRWKALLNRIAKLINKPWIFSKDNEPKDPPLYPREFLEQLAQGDRQKPSADHGYQENGNLVKWANAQRNQLFNEKFPLRAFGHVIFLVMFAFFVLADAIAVANTLIVLQVITAELPPILQRFDLAVLGGALLSAIVGIWVFIEISGDESDFIDTDKFSDARRSILKGLALIVGIFSIFVMIAFAINRLVLIGDLQSNSTADIILSAILFGLVPINSALAAAISFPEAARGAIVLLYLLAYLMVGIIPLLVLIVDIVWRIVSILLDLLFWALFTPIMAIPYVVTQGRKAINA